MGDKGSRKEYEIMLWGVYRIGNRRLADGMGLGKTRTALPYICTLPRTEQGFSSSLVMTPRLFLDTWERYFNAAVKPGSLSLHIARKVAVIVTVLTNLDLGTSS